jgi:hypothetical protein
MGTGSVVCFGSVSSIIDYDNCLDCLTTHLVLSISLQAGSYLPLHIYHCYANLLEDHARHL